MLSDAKDCLNGTQHDRQTFTQTITPDNPEFVHVRAYFIVRGCPKCKAKKYLNYKVERS